MNFGQAFEEVKRGKGMRLPQWQSDVVIRAQYPDENSKMTAPYLYVESRFGKYRTSKLRNYTGSDERILSDYIYVTITTKDNTDYVVSQNYRVFFRDMIASFSEYNYFG